MTTPRGNRKGVHRGKHVPVIQGRQNVGDRSSWERQGRPAEGLAGSRVGLGQGPTPMRLPARGPPHGPGHGNSGQVGALGGARSVFRPLLRDRHPWLGCTRGGPTKTTFGGRRTSARIPACPATVVCAGIDMSDIPLFPHAPVGGVRCRALPSIWSVVGRRSFLPSRRKFRSVPPPSPAGLQRPTSLYPIS